MGGVATSFFEVRFLSGFSNRGNMTGCLFSEFSGTGTVFCFRSCGTITVVFGRTLAAFFCFKMLGTKIFSLG
jgi:hypothetical protein